MKRPMCILAVSWLAGIFLVGHGPVIGTNVVLFLYFILIIFGLLVLKNYPQVLNSRVQSEWYPQLTLLLLLIPCLFLAGFCRTEGFLEKQAEMVANRLELLKICKKPLILCFYAENRG